MVAAVAGGLSSHLHTLGIVETVSTVSESADRKGHGKTPVKCWGR